MKRRDLLLAAAASALLPTLSLARTSYPHGHYRRIVVAGGDLTEIIFALGAGDRVIGVDQTSTWPPQVASLPQIGYVRRLSAEGVLSLGPDLLIAAHDAGPAIVFQQLRTAGLEIGRGPAAQTTDGIAAKVVFVGQILGLSREAAALSARLADELAAVQTKVDKLSRRPRVLFILSVQGGIPLVGGQDTSADEMIRLAGGLNVASSLSGYKPMNREAILAARPDVVLMMEDHASRVGGIEAVMARPEISLTPAGRAGRAVTMDGLLLLGHGPRTPQAIAQLARALHPQTAPMVGL